MTLDREVERYRRAAGTSGQPLYLEIDEPGVRPKSFTEKGRLIAAVAATVALVAGTSIFAMRRDGRPEEVTPAASSVARAADGEGWADLPASPIAGRFQHVAVGTDTGVLVWGGYGGSTSLGDGAFFEAATGLWRALPDAPLATDRGDAVGVWTGSEVVLLNGINGGVKAAAFDPTRFVWRALPDPPIATAANMMTRAAFVNGRVVVVTVSEEGEGGTRNQVATYTPGQPVDDPGAWSIGESPPGSFGSGFDAVVVGGEVVVVGRRDSGGKSCGEAVVYAYAPDTDRWRLLPTTPIANVYGAAVVSTGSEVFIGGGVECGAVAGSPAKPPAGRSEAFLLNPTTGEWRPSAGAPVPFRGNSRYAEVWSGRFAIGRGPHGEPVLYDPAADRWHVAPATPLGNAYDEVPWVWHDGELFLTSGGVANGEGGCCRPLGGGYIYTPPYGWL
jgi:hypothetical protein